MGEKKLVHVSQQQNVTGFQLLVGICHPLFAPVKHSMVALQENTELQPYFQWLIFAALISDLHPAAQCPVFYGNTISVHFNAKSCCKLSEDIVSSS